MEDSALSRGRERSARVNGAWAWCVVCMQSVATWRTAFGSYAYLSVEEPSRRIFAADERRGCGAKNARGRGRTGGKFDLPDARSRWLFLRAAGLKSNYSRVERERGARRRAEADAAPAYQGIWARFYFFSFFSREDVSAPHAAHLYSTPCILSSRSPRVSFPPATAL